MPRLRKNSLPSKTFSDIDLLLLFLSFTSYITIRFAVESGWLIGTVLTVSTFIWLRKSSKLRHKLYLYMILLFTSQEEQNWLLRKFSLNSQKYPNRTHEDYLDESRFTDAINQTVKQIWPFLRSFIEENIRRKLLDAISHLNESKLKLFGHNVVDLRADDISLGSEPPLLESLRLLTSRKANVVVYGIGFRYTGNTSLTFSTNVTKFCVENLKFQGRLKVEIGPLSPHPPFLQEIRAYMTEDPFLDFTVSNTPEKIENIARILCLEKIADIILMPNQINFPIRSISLENYFPPGVILFHIVGARNLTNKETFRNSDPFCVLQLGAQKSTTHVMKNNLNPLWNFKTQLICSCDPKTGDFDATFSIYDQDLIFNDFLFRSTLSVRRIMDEQFIDEWLSNEAGENKETMKTAKGKLRIQALWQNLADVTSSGDEEILQDRSLEACESFFERNSEVKHNVPGEENAPMGNKNDSELSTNNKHLYEAILLVWIESAEKLKPAWEDFQIELMLRDKLEKTPFASRDSKDKWYFRHRILLPVKELREDEITFKIISRSKSNCEGELVFRISNLMQLPHQDFNFKELLFKDKKYQENGGLLKLVLALKKIEAIPSPYLSALSKAEMELNEEDTIPFLRHSDRTLPLLESSKRDKKVIKKSLQGFSVFKFTEIGWDSYPAFSLQSFEKTPSATSNSSGVINKNKTEFSHVGPFVRSLEEKSCEDKDNRTISQENLPKFGSKRWGSLKQWMKSNSSCNKKP